jgi:hypothetical protein
MLEMSAMRRMGPSYAPPEGGASIRDALRALRDGGVRAAPDAAPLETQRRPDEPPRLEAATPIEGAAVGVRRLVDPPIVGFAAFLDGIQRSRVLAYHGSVPLVHGSVAAAVRVREGRRLRTWGAPRVTQALYAPIGALDPAFAAALVARVTMRDTDAAPGSHPQEFTARALTAVQRARERAEVALADAWIARERLPLLIDGGISGAGAAARHPNAVGAVKSHRTLYVQGDSLAVVLGLREGERTTAVELSSPRRERVATWYLRLRGTGERSPFFGLVRVEVAREGHTEDELTARADLVSRWLLAERAPVALPDPRWDVMVYGIHECEQYLSAIL